MARPRKYVVRLSQKERKLIQHYKRKATSQNMIVRYDILLEADENRWDKKTVIF